MYLDHICFHFSQYLVASIAEATLDTTFIFFFLKTFFLKSGLKGFYMFPIVVMSGLTGFCMFLKKPASLKKGFRFKDYYEL